jgi:predicted ABC-type ATPase
MGDQPRTEKPLFVIVAGPNGSGKSTAYEQSFPELGERTVWIVNPDRLTKRLVDVEGLAAQDANLAAIQRIEKWLAASLTVHKSVGVETVLSTAKYRRLVSQAKGLGYEVCLLYVLLDHPDRNVERVAMRISKGGHAVPEDKIRSRYWRSLEQMPWFLEQSDRAWLYDNSGSEPQLVGRKVGDVVEVYGAPPPLRKALGID